MSDTLPSSRNLNEWRPQIMVDCDGVLADFVGAVMTRVWQEGHACPKLQHFTHLNLRKCDLTSGQLMAIREWQLTPGTAAGMKWLPEAKMAISYLKCFGDVTCLTAPWVESPTWVQDRYDWLQPVFKEEEVIFCNSKYKPFVAGDVLIEDDADTLRRWMYYNRSGIGILVNQPWNEKEVCDGFRADNVLHAAQMAVHLLREKGRI